MKKQRRRLTRAEADARIAHIPPERRVQILAGFVASLRAAGVDCEIIADGTGRTFLHLDIDQVEAKLGKEVADEMRREHAISPQPVWAKPQKARTV